MDDRQQLLDAIRAPDLVAMEGAARRLADVTLDEALAMVVVLAELGRPTLSPLGRPLGKPRRARTPACTETIAQVNRLLRELPRQGEAGAVTVALRSYAAPPRTWS